ncbi:MAG TPA: hypothetical protein VEK57_11815 [Thermoanaerobaculia bacterium]|nr:hypothetical protein [Thermoanaerobaculia bacterium]
MSQFPNDAARTLIAANRKTIDAQIRAMFANLPADNPNGPVEPGEPFDRVLSTWSRVKTLLTLVSLLPLLPLVWRGALQIFIRQMDALAAPEVRTQFKAGRDL